MQYLSKQFVGHASLAAFTVAQMASDEQEDGQRDGDVHCHKRPEEQGDADEEAQYECHASRDKPAADD
jgi:hypothetical protein